MDYEKFIESKKIKPVISGFDVDAETLNSHLFDFQRACVKWALKRGRAALFHDTGLGKTIQQTSWAHEVVKRTGGNVIIFAPLCVAQQTIREAKKWGIEINYAREQSGVLPGITITNYEMIDKFDIAEFAGVVADESSIIKNRDGKTRNLIIDAVQDVPYRLSCTGNTITQRFYGAWQSGRILGRDENDRDAGNVFHQRCKRYRNMDFKGAW